MLLSRKECQERGIQFYDAANKSVIQQTPHAHDWVRLFFRPLTPTQYMMEGIRRTAEIPPTSEHCPVPVFLLFDLPTVLTMQGVSFTDGGMANAARYRMGDDAEFLRSIPMQWVYHDGPYCTPPGKDELKFRRHAEIVKAKELKLDALKLVVCRTGAERETLLHVLGADAAKWSDRIRIVPVGRGLFYREQGFHVEEVRLTEGRVFFRVFRRRGDYRMALRIVDADTGTELFYESGVKEPPQTWEQPFAGNPKRVEVELLVEDCLAYHGIVSRQSVFT